MGHAVPDRMFWAHDEDTSDEADTEDHAATPELDFPLDNTRH
jgi:hydroxymethylpyrimidine/phosphomethylpyrimidine kinase